MVFDKRQAQQRLGVVVDGDFGPVSYTALLSTTAARRVLPAYGKAAAEHLARYGIEDTPTRLAKFLGQCCHESGRFVYTRELWDPTPDQKRYDAPGNTLGNLPGDGKLLRGAGWIEVTGRRNLVAIGKVLNLDLVGDPTLLDDIEVGLLISLEWWRMNNGNAIADKRDILALSRAVNRGNPDSTKMPYGYAERLQYTSTAMRMVA